ncbi:hypothetical protein H6K62_06660, partial [Staphylococcus epidermidis]|nr:hypothetical protein [Staphylococcus epidermidis]
MPNPFKLLQVSIGRFYFCYRGRFIKCVLTNIAQLVFLLEELDVENLSELLSRLNSGYI